MSAPADFGQPAAVAVLADLPLTRLVTPLIGLLAAAPGTPATIFARYAEILIQVNQCPTAASWHI
jgi:hypothetical protein